MRSLPWIAVALPLAALGQEVPGIDLSTPPKPPAPEERKAPPPTPAPEKARPEAKEASPLEAALGAPGERDAALGDRVKAVQRKGFMRAHRLQLTALFTPSVNDAFYQKYGLGGRLAWSIQDSFALGVRGAYYARVQTSYKRQAALAFQSQLLVSQPYGDLMAEALWSPVYGKLSWLERSIVHFDVFLAAGFGVAWSATSFAPRNEGPHLAAEVGGGVRFYPKDWLALEAGVLATLYPDQTDRAVPATIQKVVCASLGVSFFFPFSFEYVYP
jgi:outer membrane beta-barrel protein